MLFRREIAKDVERSVGYAFNKVTTVNQFSCAALMARQIFLLCSMKATVMCDEENSDFAKTSGSHPDISSAYETPCLISNFLSAYGPGLVLLVGFTVAFKVWTLRCFFVQYMSVRPLMYSPSPHLPKTSKRPVEYFKYSTCFLVDSAQHDSV